MNRYINRVLLIAILLAFAACKEVLEPKPVASIINEVALNEANDVPNAQIGLYSAFRRIGAPAIIAGDFTADIFVHNGTFTNYRELGNKEITSSNSSISSLWGNIYNAAYIANFILEKLPDLRGVPQSLRNQVLAEARFLRGYAYFIGAYTYGGMPIVTSTNVEANKVIPRSGKAEVLALVLEDYLYALSRIAEESTTPAFASRATVQAALARYYLYSEDWANAEKYASAVISFNDYPLPAKYADVVNLDFPTESIFELGYTQEDDPGTLFNLFVARREIIPSNQTVFALNSAEAGERSLSATFDPKNIKGGDNGWQVAKFGNAQSSNNNIVIFRAAEMYLIRAEARAQLGKVTGVGSAVEDINVLRARAKAPTLTSISQSQILLVIERERLYELAFEGHRWFDLVRTGRANAVMLAFSPNWQDKYNVWPIPQSEIQRNPSLRGQQNPDY